MLKQFLILSFALMLTACQQSGEEVVQSAEQLAVKAKSSSAKSAPKAKKIPHAMTVHGDTRVDQYYWMRDDQRTNPEILDHLRAENEYTDWALSHTKDLQGKIVKELNERISKDD